MKKKKILIFFAKGLQEMLNKILCHSTYSEEADVIQFLNIRDTLMLEKAIAYYRSKVCYKNYA